jgi:AcrR family transcriptional regulator
VTWKEIPILTEDPSTAYGDAVAGVARKDGQRRREDLLDAALACFADRGIVATGIEDIRRKADASPSSVYHQFGGGLPAIVLALLGRTFDRNFAHLVARVVPTRTAKAAIHALVDGHLEWVLRHRREARFMYQAMALELAADGDAGRALQARKAEALAPAVIHLAGFVAVGKLPDWTVQEFDVVLLGATHEACRRFLGGAPIDPAWMRETLPRVAWDTARRAARR